MKRRAYFVNFATGFVDEPWTFEDLVNLYGERVATNEGAYKLRYFLNDAGQISARLPDGTEEQWCMAFKDPAKTLMRWALADRHERSVWFDDDLGEMIKAVLSDDHARRIAGKKLTVAQKKNMVLELLAVHAAATGGAPLGLLPAIAE